MKCVLQWKKQLRRVYGDGILIKLIPYFSVISATADGEVNKSLAWH